MDDQEPSESTSSRPAPRKPTRDLPPLPSESLPRPEPAAADNSHPSHPPDDSTLTPLRAHYLKKTLIALQFHNELTALIDPPTSTPNVSPFSYLGPPFSPPPKSAPPLDLPFSRFMFRNFVLSFPFLASAPKDFFPSKLQPFMTSLLSRNISFADNPLRDPNEETEAHAQEKALQRLGKHFTFLLGSAIKLVEKEEVVRLSQADLKRLETLTRRRRERAQKAKNIFEVNVICVRTVTEKGRVRSRAHEEFVIRTRRSNRPDIIVSRRYGDFKTLADELRKAHPEEAVRPPPHKDRTTVSVPANNPSPSYDYHDSNDSLPLSPPLSGSASAVKLARERNRLTLRSYLHSLMGSATIASSPVLQSFLTASPIQLTAAEEEDARRREEADRVREEGKRRFAEEIAIRVETLRGALRQVKGEMMGQNGLTSLFAVVKANPNILELPPEYRAVLEWGRTSLAAALFQSFIASDTSSENLSGLKRLHGLMPYMILKGVLKISNPVGMIRGALDLFLAQPFGGRSLLQRMFTSSLQEEVKALQEDIAAVEDKVEDPMICEKLKYFINAPSEIQEVYHADADAEHMNILTCILRSSEEPTLNRVQMQRVVRAHRAHAQYLRHREGLADSDDDDGPQDDDAWLYEDLRVLAKLYARLRDREQLISLIFEGTTSEVLKDILTIFYTPLAQVYKAASIADSIGDLQNFVNDLVRTVELVEESSQQDASHSVNAFLDLVERHQQAFYSFVHKVHTKGEVLFSSLMKWIELFLTFIREGFRKPISLEFILPHGGEERKKMMSEIDAIALYHYKLKIAHEEKLQRRFGKEGETINMDDQLASELLRGATGNFDIGEVIQEEAGEIDGESSEYSSEDEETESGETEYETDTGSEDSPVTRHPKPPGRSGGQQFMRPSKSMTFPRTAPADRKNFDLPPLPPLAPGAGGSSNPIRQANTARTVGSPVARSKTAMSPQIARPPQRRPSDSALRSKRPPPEAAKKSTQPRSKQGSGNEYPTLAALPQLLPLFVEIIRPQLLNYR